MNKKIDNNLVSVITLAYNSMEVIYETIDSILAQNYPAIEVVIADDCSDDFEEEKIKSYILDHKKGNIKNFIVYQNKINLGTVKNINTAIKCSSGHVIVNLSSGDLFFSNTTISDIVDEFVNTGCKTLCTRRAFFMNNISNVVQFMPNDKEIEFINKFKKPQNEYEAFYTGFLYHMASGSAFAYRRDFLDEVGYFDERYRLWEDGPFFAKCIKENGLLHCNYSLTTIYYRYGGVSTGSGSPLMRQDALLFLNEGLSDPSISNTTKKHIKYRISKIEMGDCVPVLLKIRLFFKYPIISLKRYFMNKKVG